MYILGLPLSKILDHVSEVDVSLCGGLPVKVLTKVAGILATLGLCVDPLLRRQSIGILSECSVLDAIEKCFSIRLHTLSRSNWRSNKEKKKKKSPNRWVVAGTY